VKFVHCLSCGEVINSAVSWPHATVRRIGALRGHFRLHLPSPAENRDILEKKARIISTFLRLQIQGLSHATGYNKYISFVKHVQSSISPHVIPM